MQKKTFLRTLFSWFLWRFFSLRRVWRYQRGNQNPYITEEQTTQLSKGQTTIYKSCTFSQIATDMFSVLRIYFLLSIPHWTFNRLDEQIGGYLIRHRNVFAIRGRLDSPRCVVFLVASPFFIFSLFCVVCFYFVCIRSVLCFKFDLAVWMSIFVCLFGFFTIYLFVGHLN